MTLRMEFSHNIVQTSNTYALPGNFTIYNIKIKNKNKLINIEKDKRN